MLREQLAVITTTMPCLYQDMLLDDVKGHGRHGATAWMAAKNKKKGAGPSALPSNHRALCNKETSVAKHNSDRDEQVLQHSNPGTPNKRHKAGSRAAAAGNA